jgi:hypothetical protein
MSYVYTTYETVEKQVTLSKKDLKAITIAYLKILVYPGEYLREVNGKTVVKQDDPFHRHGSISEVYVRDASEFDIAVFDMLAKLKKVQE